MVTSLAKHILAEFCLQENGLTIFWNEWKLSPDMKYILVKANYHKVCTNSPQVFSLSGVSPNISNGDIRASAITTSTAWKLKPPIHFFRLLIPL